jgi:hypothetical protein
VGAGEGFLFDSCVELFVLLAGAGGGVAVLLSLFANAIAATATIIITATVIGHTFLMVRPPGIFFMILKV